MKLIGLMPVRNEDWVLGLSARVALLWVDDLVLLDHASTDRTQQILTDLAGEFPERVQVLREANPQWDEMMHRQRLLDAARGRGATHIAIVDADELLTANFIPNIRFHIATMPGGHILMLPGYNLRGGLDLYHQNGIWGNRWFSTGFVDDQRLHWAGDKFHSREPGGRTLRNYQPIDQGIGGVMHLWGASERRLRAKSALYKVTERLRWPEKSVAEVERMYSWAIKGEPGHASFGTPDTWTYTAVPTAWWASYSGLMQYLHVDSAPWQEAEVRQLIDRHGAEIVAGLDLFGLGA